MYYYRFGDRISDYHNLQSSPLELNYNVSQHTLICGECDFSFSASLIQQRKSGRNMCTTAWCYYDQWVSSVTKQVGFDEFEIFEKCVKFCEKNGCKVSFGIDGKWLTQTEHEWNDKCKPKSKLFDRIIYTFPRCSYAFM